MVVKEGAGFDKRDTVREYSAYSYGFFVRNEGNKNYQIQDKYTLYLPYRKRRVMNDAVNEYLDWV